MRTFLIVKAALLPLPIYGVGVALGWPLAASAAGLAYAIVWALWRHRGQVPPAFETAIILSLAASVTAQVAGGPDLANQASAIVLATLSAGAFASLARGRPWTSEFSASAHRTVSDQPLFHSINWWISALWGVLFAWLAAAAFMKLPALAHWLPVAAGGIASVALPRVMMARGLKSIAAGDRRNAWTAPTFDAPLVDRTSRAAAEDAVDVAVVGAGIGGLTAAALLAQSGLRVAVFEHHVLPGGFAHTWVRRARGRDPVTGKPVIFRFDSGVHDVSGWHEGGTVRSIFERLGIAHGSQWARLDHRYVTDGHTIDVPRDWRDYARQIGARFPHEATGIAALFEDIHAIYTGMFSTARERGGIPGAPLTTAGLLTFARAHPLAVKWLKRPWLQLVRLHVEDPEAIRSISALSGYVTDDMTKVLVGDMVPLFGYYFEGGYYPIGGSGVMADSLVGAIERHGGQVHLKSPVARILVENGVACGLVVAAIGDKPARTVRAKAVVCNADVGLLKSRLLAGVPEAAELAAQTVSSRPACSAFGVHLGVHGKLDLPGVVHVSGTAGNVGIVCPSAVDPTVAPEGYATIELLTLLPNDEARTWFPPHAATGDMEHDALRRSEAYEARKREMGDRLIAAARSAIPDLDQRIVYRCDASPVTFQRYAWTADGSIYGATFAGQRPATRTPICNLVLAGAATHGPGVEAVVISGAYAAEALRPGLLAKGAVPVAIAA